MIREREQFRILYRDFLARVIDVDLLSLAGDPETLYIYTVSILAGFDSVVAFSMVSGWVNTKLSGNALALAMTGNQHFLVSTTMMVVGLFAVVSWGCAFPDKRDCHILGTLPVRPRTLFLAKLSAVATGLGVCLVAVNVFTGVILPMISPSPAGGDLSLVRSFAAYWITMLAAGAFSFFLVQSVHGLAVLLLPYRHYQRFSAPLQLTALFCFVAGYFLTPGGSLIALTSPAHRELLLALPSYWFLGLYQQVLGPLDAIFGPLAARGMLAVLATAAVTSLAFALAYLRGMRHIVEQPDIAPARHRRWLDGFAHSLTVRLLRRPVDHAIVLFAARGVARSAHHRLLLAVCLGIAAAVAMAYSRDFLFAGSRLLVKTSAHEPPLRWDEPNVALLVVSWTLLSAAGLGVRWIYELPIALKASWIFRVTMVHHPHAYFAAAKKSVYLLAVVPAGVLSAVFYLSLWPAAPVLAHMLMWCIGAVILVERAFTANRKIPFACAYSPGKSEWPLTVSFGVYGTLLWALIDLGTRFEHAALSRPRNFALWLVFLAVVAWREARRWRAFASEPLACVQFDDSGLPGIAPLDLRRDGLWGAERFLEQHEWKPEMPLHRRLLRWARP